MATQRRDEPVGLVLADVPDDADGGGGELLDGDDLLPQGLRVSHRQRVSSQGPVGAAAGEAGLEAAAAGEGHVEGIGRPLVAGEQPPAQVAIAEHVLDETAVVDLDVEHFGLVRERVGHYLAAALPGEVGHLRGFLFRIQRPQEVYERMLGRVAPQHVVHVGRFDDLSVEVGGGEPAEHHGDLRVLLLADTGQVERAVGVDHPVEVDAEDHRLELSDEPPGVEARALGHLDGEVDDADLEAVAARIFQHRKEPQGVVLEER